MATRRSPNTASIVLTLTVAAVIGFLIGALVAATEDDASSAPGATAQATPREPSPSPTATGSPATPAVPSDSQLTLEADRTSATTSELIQLTGTLSPAAGDVTLQVQQSVDGIGFVDFPVTATTRSDGSFAIKVRTGRVGTNEFRMVLPGESPQVVSNPVTVEIS